MNVEDRSEFDKAKPFIEGIIALLFKLRFNGTDKDCFRASESFVKEFIDRN